MLSTKLLFAMHTKQAIKLNSAISYKNNVLKMNNKQRFCESHNAFIRNLITLAKILIRNSINIPKN